MKEISNITCPHCNGTKIKKNGHTPNGKQRFYCRICGKSFTTSAKFKISKKARLVLGVLYNLLDKDFYDSESLQQALQNACLQEKELNLDDVDYDGCLCNHKVQGSYLRYRCYNPKLILCVEDNKIKLYKIHPANKETKNKFRNIVIQEKLHKEQS